MELSGSLNARENLRKNQTDVSVSLSRMGYQTRQNRQTSVTTDDDKVRVVYANCVYSSDDVDHKPSFRRSDNHMMPTHRRRISPEVELRAVKQELDLATRRIERYEHLGKEI
jgi:hypothetical protein